MDNIGKAISMGGVALLFIIAASTSIFLYSSLLDYTKNIVTTSDHNNRAESASNLKENNKRVITESEVIMALININTMNVNAIKVDDNTYMPINEELFKVNSNEFEINKYNFKTIIRVGSYSYTYDINDNIVIYKWEG